MRLETYEDLVALSPAEAVTLGYAGDSEGVRDERAQSALMLLEKFGSDPGYPRAQQVQIAEAIWRNQGSIAGTLHELEQEAGRYEQWVRGQEAGGPLAAPLSQAHVRRLRETVLPRPVPLLAGELGAMSADIETVDALTQNARAHDDWRGVNEAQREVAAFARRYDMPVEAGRHVVESDQFVNVGHFNSSTAQEAGEAWQHAHDAVAASHEHLVELADQHGPSAQSDYERAEGTHDRLAQAEDRLNADIFDRWGVNGETLHHEESVLAQSERVAAARQDRGHLLDGQTPGFDAARVEEASQGQVAVVSPWFGHEDDEPHVALFAADSPEDQGMPPMVTVRRGAGGELATGVGHYFNEQTERDVTDRAVIAQALHVDEPTATATIGVAYGELERARSLHEQTQGLDANALATFASQPVNDPRQEQTMNPSPDYYEAADDGYVPVYAGAERDKIDRQDIAASTFNSEKINAVADVRIGATAVQFGESLEDASVDLANWTHGSDRVQVHVDADNRVRADVIGPNATDDADVSEVATALGINDADARQAVMEAAHQLNRGQVAYAAVSDADEQVEAFDAEHGQQAREALRWNADTTREQEQTMDQQRQNGIDAVDGADRSALEPDHGTPVRDGRDAVTRDDEGEVDVSMLVAAWGVDEQTARQEVVRGLTEPEQARPSPEQGRQESTRETFNGGNAGSDEQSQEKEPDVDEMVNMGMVDDRAGARQGQDRAEPARQRVDMQKVQEQIATLDGVGAGHGPNGYDRDQELSQDRSMRM